MEKPKICIYCKGKMEEGVLSSNSQAWRKVRSWGKAYYNFLGMKIVRSYRCMSCGTLQIIAED